MIDLDPELEAVLKDLASQQDRYKRLEGIDSKPRHIKEIQWEWNVHIPKGYWHMTKEQLMPGVLSAYRERVKKHYGIDHPDSGVKPLKEITLEDLGL